MYRDLLEKTEEYLKTENIPYEKVEFELELKDYSGLMDYLSDYLENKYLVNIPKELKDACKTLDDVFEMTAEEIFYPAACMETYALLNSFNIGYRKHIPKAFINYLTEWIETGDYRWDVPKKEKEKLLRCPLDEINLDEFRVLPSTVYYLEDAVDSYLYDDPDAEAVKLFPPETKEEKRAWEIKEPNWHKKWPYPDELPVRFRYPAEMVREADEKGEPVWELRVRRKYEEYRVLQHRTVAEYLSTDAVFVRPNSTVSIFNGKEKIQFFDYIRDEQGTPIGIRCLIAGGDGVEEKEFRIEELYRYKTVEANSTTDTLIQYSYRRKYEITE